MNPFIISGYKSPKYFCDRKKETKRLISAIQNSRNVTLVSERRLGKTGLLKHVENQLSGDIAFIYIDLYPSLDLNDFIQLLSNGIIHKLEPFSEKVMKKITGFFSAFNPKFSFDPVSGSPNLEFSISNKAEADKSIGMLFEYIRNSGKKVSVAFDEFQQIMNYPEKNVEAILRSEIQKDTETCFVFSGSQTHLLISMFNEYSRPFYQSTEVMELGKIEKEEYTPFISAHFEENRKNLNLTTAEFIYEINRGITYNMQYTCNRLFALDNETISEERVKNLMNQIVKENEIFYLLVKGLWKFPQKKMELVLKHYLKGRRRNS